MPPDFSWFEDVEIKNRRTGKSYCLIRGDQLDTGACDRADEIVAICRQPSIYESIFRDLLKGEPYSRLHGESFLKMTEEGWRNDSCFVFLVLTTGGEIAAAADIKSPDLGRAEIGYWCSEDHRGLMTETIIQLCSIGKRAGYRQLFGSTKPENKPSISVLLGAGFSEKEGNVTEPGESLTFSRVL